MSEFKKLVEGFEILVCDKDEVGSGGAVIAVAQQLLAAAWRSGVYQIHTAAVGVLSPSLGIAKWMVDAADGVAKAGFSIEDEIRWFDPANFHAVDCSVSRRGGTICFHIRGPLPSDLGDFREQSLSTSVYAFRFCTGEFDYYVVVPHPVCEETVPLFGKDEESRIELIAGRTSTYLLRKKVTA